MLLSFNKNVDTVENKSLDIKFGDCLSKNNSSGINHLLDWELIVMVGEQRI